MNKKMLSEKVADILDIKVSEAYSFINLFIQTSGEALKKGDRIVLAGFGVLKPIQRKEKKVLNPNNGKKMTIKPYKTVKFKPSENLLNKLNKK